MDKKYWEVENPAIVEAGKQRFKYYRQGGMLEVCTKIYEDGSERETRRQTISAYKLQDNGELRNMVMDFLEDAGLVRKVDKQEG